MTPSYRLTRLAQEDVATILQRSGDQFGSAAQERYRALIARAIRDAAARPNRPDEAERTDLGDGVFTWHLSQSRRRSAGGVVQRPRHFLICRRDGDVLIVGRVLHDAMDLRRHVADQAWD